MYEELKGTIIDINKIEYKDFPIFLNGHVFIEYDNGWITEETSDFNVLPQTVSLRQAREILIKRGLFEKIEEFINNIPDPLQKLIVKNYWEYSTVFDRNNDVVIQMGVALGLSPHDLDLLFLEASKL